MRDVFDNIRFFCDCRYQTSCFCKTGKILPVIITHSDSYAVTERKSDILAHCVSQVFSGTGQCGRTEGRYSVKSDLQICERVKVLKRLQTADFITFIAAGKLDPDTFILVCSILCSNLDLIAVT